MTRKFAFRRIVNPRTTIRKLMAPEENTAMLTKITLALALLIAALATMAPAGPGDGGQGSFSYGDNSTGMASGGGNLVPLW
jgi:hypothetical protein